MRQEKSDHEKIFARFQQKVGSFLWNKNEQVKKKSKVIKKNFEKMNQSHTNKKKDQKPTKQQIKKKQQKN